MIIDAVIPLLIEHGRQLTSKQIAEAAGVAEGTIFRAFGDKESLIEAAVVRYLDPEPLRRALREVDPALTLDVKVRTIVVLLRERFGNVFRVMAAVGYSERPPGGDQRQVFAEIVATILEPDLERLSLPTVRIASFIRLIAFSSAFPQLNENVGFSDDELAQIILYGIAGHPDSANDPAVRAAAGAGEEG
jgi:AcrR family transcriptional regulator